MGGVRLVTVEGELIEASGAMVGGDMERTQLKFGSSSATEREKVAEKLREVQAQSETVASRLEDVRRDILDPEGQLKDHGSQTGAGDGRTSGPEGQAKS